MKWVRRMQWRILKMPSIYSFATTIFQDRRIDRLLQAIHTVAHTNANQLHLI